MSFSRYVFKSGYYPEIITAHTHIILAGSVIDDDYGCCIVVFSKSRKRG